MSQISKLDSSANGSSDPNIKIARLYPAIVLDREKVNQVNFQLVYDNSEGHRPPGPFRDLCPSEQQLPPESFVGNILDFKPNQLPIERFARQIDKLAIQWDTALENWDKLLTEVQQTSTSEGTEKSAQSQDPKQQAHEGMEAIEHLLDTQTWEGLPQPSTDGIQAKRTIPRFGTTIPDGLRSNESLTPHVPKPQLHQLILWHAG
nr:uncharacterized protein CI109_004243 [Kwoniella shandongensis]KAA5527427.1 hypothetical protein CI109_004243 [Kwoniella shandongensis]